MNRYHYIHNYKKYPYEPRFPVGTKLSKNSIDYIVESVEDDQYGNIIYLIVHDTKAKVSHEIVRESYIEREYTRR